jgi:hypothetical protein
MARWGDQRGPGVEVTLNDSQNPGGRINPNKRKRRRLVLEEEDEDENEDNEEGEEAENRNTYPKDWESQGGFDEEAGSNDENEADLSAKHHQGQDLDGTTTDEDE